MSSTNGSTSRPNVIGGDETQRIVLTSRNKRLSTNLERVERTVHKSLLGEWSEGLEKNGFAACVVGTCNFISLEISNIQNHYQICDGIPIYNKNLCDICGNYLPSYGELVDHKSACKEMKKAKKIHLNTDQGKQRSITRSRQWESKIKNTGEACCGYKDCNFIGTRLSDLEDHFQACKGVPELDGFCCPNCKSRFQTKEECNRHNSKCRTNGRMQIDGKVHFSVIRRMKDVDDDHIIQPVPEFPQGEYRRRRPYTKEHKNSWTAALEKNKYVKCMYQNCYFIAMSLEDMVSHYGYCSGDGNFARFPCPLCGGRVTSKAVLAKHLERSHPSDGSSRQEAGPVDVPKENSVNPPGVPAAVEEYALQGARGMQDSQNDARSRKRKREVESTADTQDNKSQRKSCDGAENIAGEDGPNDLEGAAKRGCAQASGQHVQDEEKKETVADAPRTRKKGGKAKTQPSRSNSSGSGATESVKCGKCEFEGTRKSFVGHNLKKHVGLGWIQGETPVNMDDEKEVIRLVKTAFKVTKKGTCENCQDVKKSFMGFVTHIQNCGKSAEEKHALKVQCPHCPGKYLKYSLPVHIKLSHSTPQESKAEPEPEAEKAPVSGKRRSALKAVTKFQESLSDADEPEQPAGASYFLHRKDDGKLPKLCGKLNNLWYKLKREKKKIPCRHGSCKTVSDDVKEARRHHFTCPFLPERVFMCEACDFYSEEEAPVQAHMTVHRSWKQRKTSGEEEAKKGEEEAEREGKGEGEEDEDEDAEGSDLSDGDTPRKRRKKSSGKVASTETEDEATHRQNFCRREDLENARGFHFYNNCLGMTLDEETAEAEASEPWPELHTSLQDWCRAPPEMASLHFPELAESMSFGSPGKWRKLKRFAGDLVEGVPVMFLGGSVRSMSWCKVSFQRMMKKAARQYLAVSTDRSFEHFKDVNERSPLSKSSLLQIWDCGVLENAPATEAPRFALGIIHETGEIWDLTWFPVDTSAEGSEERLPRLGLLATASQDGAVRVWSVCNPSHLANTKGLPIYETEPVAKLITDDNFEESCFRLSVGRDGVVAGGYSKGTLALWNLRNLSSPFCKKVGKCRIVKAHSIIQAHRTSITAMALCPGNSRYVSTGATDRLIKLWDMESPSVPVEQSGRELCLDMVWTRNWPLLVYSFDDILPGSSKGLVKFVRGVLWERHQSSFSMESTCLSLSFSDWLNALSASSNTGEVKIRLMKNFISDQKKVQSTLSRVHLESLAGADEGEGAAGGATYEGVASRFGLVFKDDLGVDKGKPRKPEIVLEEPPARAANKVAFNPNLGSFTHLAVGYNCGLLRIQPLRELQGTKSIKSFLEETRRKH